MREWRPVLLLMMAAFLSVAASAQAGGPAGEAKLPVRRVVLYKNGVGYFEHTGRVRDAQNVSVNFTTAQLNDVLKSLTVLDLGRGQVTGVSYNSLAPLRQRLSGLRLPVGENTTQAAFLSVMRGARVEIRSGTAAVTGRLLSVENREIKRKDESTAMVYVVSIVSDAGEVRSFDLTPATSVRVLDRDLHEEIGRYMNLISTAREQDVRCMTISTAGRGERELFVSYISEVPVWKSTYRIVMPGAAGAKPLLQGWAIVDNTVGEDWKNVELSLVAGAPQSFVQQLSTPYYARRPVVALPEMAMLTPQTHEHMLDDRDALAAEAGVIGGVPGGIPGGQSGGVVSSIISSAPAAKPQRGTGGGVGAGMGGGYGGGAYRADGGVVRKELVADALRAAEAAASGREVGDLFEYKLKQPVTIHKNESALVPIVQAEVQAEKVTLWNTSSQRPLRALWLTNSSGQTLDGGSFNVLEDATFSGEGLMEPIKPGEKRLLSYAVDLGVVVESARDSQQEQVSRVRIARGVLVHTRELRERRIYIVRNENTDARAVVIEHPARAGMKFAEGSAKPVESTPSFHRFRLTVKPKTTANLTVLEYQPISTEYQLNNVNSDLIATLVKQRALDAATEQALRRIVAQKDGIAALETQIDSRKKEIATIFDDQQRVRENLKALKGSAEERELTQRYTRQLDQQEDRVQALRRELAELQQKRDQAREELNKNIEAMTFESGD